MKTFNLKHEVLEDIISAYLYSIGAVDDAVDVISIDLGLPVDEDGFIEFDLVTSDLPQLRLVK